MYLAVGRDEVPYHRGNCMCQIYHCHVGPLSTTRELEHSSLLRLYRCTNILLKKVCGESLEPWESLTIFNKHPRFRERKK